MYVKNTIQFKILLASGGTLYLVWYRYISCVPGSKCGTYSRRKYEDNVGALHRVLVLLLLLRLRLDTWIRGVINNTVRKRTYDTNDAAAVLWIHGNPISFQH